MDADEERDQLLEETVERSLAPYRHLVSPEVLAVMREMAMEALTEDEVGRDLLERARRERPVAKTGTRETEPTAGPDRKAGGGDGG